MPLTNAEKQKAFRQRRKVQHDNAMDLCALILRKAQDPEIVLLAISLSETLEQMKG